MRNRLSGISRVADIARLALSGNAAKRMPSIAKNKADRGDENRT